MQIFECTWALGIKGVNLWVCTWLWVGGTNTANNCKMGWNGMPGIYSLS